LAVLLRGTEQRELNGLQRLAVLVVRLCLRLLMRYFLMQHRALEL
jgi:hypothetical protein